MIHDLQFIITEYGNGILLLAQSMLGKYVRKFARKAVTTFMKQIIITFLIASCCARQTQYSILLFFSLKCYRVKGGYNYCLSGYQSQSRIVCVISFIIVQLPFKIQSRETIQISLHLSNTLFSIAYISMIYMYTILEI